MEIILLQYKLYRNFFTKRTFVYSDEQWIDIKAYTKGDKITKVDGKWNTQAFCVCGNELVHSQSFMFENSYHVFEYECSVCKKWQWKNPGICMGLHSCDETGRLI